MIQLFVPISSTFANTAAEPSQKDSTGRIEVKKMDQSQKSIKWRVTINATGIENEGIVTKIHFSAGLSHGTITEIENTLIRQTEEGYEIQTPPGSDTYEIDLITGMSDSNQTNYELKATAEYTDGKFEAFKRTEPLKEPLKEPTKDKAVEEKEAKAIEKVEKSDPSKAGEVLPDEEPAKEKRGSDTASQADTAAQRYTPPQNLSAPLDDFNPVWPEPGGLNLSKKGESTGKYGEWEVKLQVEGKDLQETSDIVLVLDISSSMSSNRRFPNMLKAAKNFVQTVMEDESSTARIALVQFDRDPQTLLDFQGVENKDTLLNTIDKMEMGRGTNIQGGIHEGRKLLAQSTASRKVMLLLSDGDPTRSYRANHGERYQWEDPQASRRYNYRITEFDYGTFHTDDRKISIDGKRVEIDEDDHVIATLSEAKMALDEGYDMYSIGLEVRSGGNANMVLRNSQNKGYYDSTSDELPRVFAEIADQMSRYAARNAIVTDPIGEMFNLVKDGSYNGANFEASHGSVDWNDDEETFTWNIGTIKEDEVYTLKYKVTIDWAKNPKGNMLYPMNGDTPLNYKNPRGQSSTKNFPIPEGKIDKGTIIKKGYRVNVDGQPIDSNGNVVSSPAEAEQFYDVFHEEVGSRYLRFDATYSVTPDDVPGYSLHVGTNPTEVTFGPTPTEIGQTVWFGYVMNGGDVTVQHVDEDGNPIADQEMLSGKVGESYSTKQKEIEGYQFHAMHPDSAPARGTFSAEEQTVIYVYKKKLGSLTVIKKNEEGHLLPGATFELRDKNNHIVGTAQTSDENGRVIFENVDWGDYTLFETKAPDGYRVLKKPIDVNINANHLQVELEVENTKIGWELPATGGIGTTLFYVLGVIMMAVAIVVFFKRKKTN